VSIYLPIDPASSGEAEWIEFKTLASRASSQLGEAGVGVRVVRQFEDEFGYLYDDEEFSRYQARSLAAFAAPESLITFRLPNRLVSQVEVSDRFYLRPLLRTLTFPHVAFVLALAQGSVRVVEVSPGLDPVPINLDDLPSDVASAAGKSSISDRAPIRRLQGSEGQKVRMHQYARKVERALRPFLNGLEVPLIRAAAEPMDSIYRSVNTYPRALPLRRRRNTRASHAGGMERLVLPALQVHVDFSLVHLVHPATARRFEVLAKDLDPDVAGVAGVGVVPDRDVGALAGLHSGSGRDVRSRVALRPIADAVRSHQVGDEARAVGPVLLDLARAVGHRVVVGLAVSAAERRLRRRQHLRRTRQSGGCTDAGNVQGAGKSTGSECRRRGAGAESFGSGRLRGLRRGQLRSERRGSRTRRSGQRPRVG
jgi:hypothetical protein